MSSGYLITVDEDVILFDFGPGTYHRMLEAGIKATDVTHVFFSHLHYDHCLDYARLLLTRWDQGVGRIPELKVYGPPHTRLMTERLIGADGAFGPDLEARTRHPLSTVIYEARGGMGERQKPAPEIVEFSPGDIVDNGNWSIQVASVKHVQPWLHCFGYRLQTDDGVLAYSGDAGPCQSMMQLARNADVLIHMCHYLSGTELGKEFAQGCMGHMELAKLGQQAAVQNLVISHITEQMDVAGVREQVLRDMHTIYSGNLFFGEDLMKIPVQSPDPRSLN